MKSNFLLMSFFDFYGVKVKLNTNSDFIVENISKDFSYFQEKFSQRPHLEVFSFHEEPPYFKIPELKASLYKDNAICYDDKNTRYIDYHGEALGIYKYKGNVIELYSLDLNLLWELTYLGILSRVGEELDKKGIHRIHALGISINKKAILVILPMGGGKTTLALELLKYDNVKLISDDTPLITRSGKVLPFPIRIGISPAVASKLSVPSRYLRNFIRSKYGPKVLIDIDYFKDKISEPCAPGVILIGERVSSDTCRIEKISKVCALKPFIINGILGLGLPQLIEYLLWFKVKKIFSMGEIITSRFCPGFKIIWYSKIYKFFIGRDIEKNVNVLLKLLSTD